MNVERDEPRLGLEFRWLRLDHEPLRLARSGGDERI
jgi:hypothetical protein